MKIFIVTLLWGMSCYLSAAAPSKCMLPVHVQEKTIDNYLYQTNMSAMSAFTMCFWLERYPEDINNEKDYLVSLSVPGSDNEMLFGWRGNSQMSLFIRNEEIKLPIPVGESRAKLWNGWNKHCITWEAGGFIKWYTDRDVAGKVELISQKCATASTIRAGGYMILMQDQDSVGGSLDINQVAVGKMAGFNMWDFEMATAVEINAASCQGTGNVASWDTLQEKGQSSKLSRPFPQCSDMLPVYVQQKTVSSYLYQPNMPAMSALTICFWMERYPEHYNRKNDFIVSLAVPEQYNELLIGRQGNFSLFLSINGFTKHLIVPAGETMASLWNGWNKHCFTWKSGGSIKWYTDRAVSGQVELVASTAANSFTIRAGGHMTLLQEQDSFGGSFEIHQVAVGKIAEFNMWNYEMTTAAQINSETCGKQGNVTTMESLREKGTSGFFYRHFPQCAA